MTEAQPEHWKARAIQHFLPWDHRPVRPAEVVEVMCDLLVDHKNVIEDANYAKYVPNQFVVEVSPANYRKNYQPIETHIIPQWQNRIQEHLLLANNRLGRIEYRLAGRLVIQIRPSDRLPDDQARVLYRLDSTAQPEPPRVTACLELLTDGRRYRLKPGVTTLGRSQSCDIPLDLPIVISKRLVSSRHAYVVCDGQRCRLFDGDPAGGASLNGTYVNNRYVPPDGHELHEGDLIILAAQVLGQPSPDTPGVAVLRFVGDCT